MNAFWYWGVKITADAGTRSAGSLKSHVSMPCLPELICSYNEIYGQLFHRSVKTTKESIANISTFLGRFSNPAGASMELLGVYDRPGEPCVALGLYSKSTGVNLVICLRTGQSELERNFHVRTFACMAEIRMAEIYFPGVPGTVWTDTRRDVRKVP